MKRMFGPDEEKTFNKLLKYIGVAIVLVLLAVGFDEQVHFGVSCSIHSIPAESK
jgi:hypothetical protein